MPKVTDQSAVLDRAPIRHLLPPRELIRNIDHSRRIRRDIAGVLCIFGGPDNTAQSNPTVIAIDRYGIVVSNSIFGQPALDLSYQQSILRALCWRLIVVTSRRLHTVILARPFIRDRCLLLTREYCGAS